MLRLPQLTNMCSLFFLQYSTMQLKVGIQEALAAALENSLVLLVALKLDQRSIPGKLALDGRGLIVFLTYFVVAP